MKLLSKHETNLVGRGLQSHLFSLQEIKVKLKILDVLKIILENQTIRYLKEIINFYSFTDYSPMNVASHPSLRGGLISAAAAPMSSLSRHYKLLMMIVISVIFLSTLH